jgi:hypothetical protein
LKQITNSDSNVKTFDSTALTEGQTYIYECEIQLNGRLIKGSQRLTQRTASINPPNFQGITSATALSPSSARLNWNPVGAGVLPARFVVYANPGSEVDWEATPLDSNVTSSATQYTVSGLGDGLPYAFGVRACSETDNCDLNAVKRSITLADTPNAPASTGAASAVFANGVVTVTAPWTHPQGKILKRHVIISTDSGFTSPTAELIDVTDPLAVPTSFVLSSPFVDNTTYYFRVQDEDGSGLNNNNTSTVSVNSGDLTPPTFDEVEFVSVERSTPEETAMKVKVTAVSRQPGDPNGVSHYVVFLKSYPEGTLNNTACSTGTRWAEFDVTNLTHFPSYVVGNDYDLNVTGLSPRTLYGVCVKARDGAGNLSNTNKAVWHRTADVVAPEFVGLGASHSDNAALINLNTQEIEISWKLSSSSDASTYNVRIWRGSSTTQNDLQVFSNIAHPIKTNKIARSTFSYTDFETLYASVEACDDALSKGYNANANNCTLGPTVSARVRGFSVPDITPPQGFDGISEAFPTLGSTASSFSCAGGSTVALAQGEALVCWTRPFGGSGNWSDYSKFRVYSYAGGVLTQVGDDVYCSGSGASTVCPTQVKITGLEAYRTYRLHVRAIDAAGAITDLNPVSKSFDARTRDTSPPLWSSGAGLNSSAANPPVFSWAAASDNQKDLDARIKYQLFRRSGTAFTDPNNYTAIVAEKDKQFSERESTQVSDPENFSEGQTFYYVICARDSSDNRVCDGSSMKEYVVPDRTPPSITAISVLNAAGASTKTLDDKTFRLQFSINDNRVNLGVITKQDLQVSIYRKAGDDTSVDVARGEDGFPTEDDFLDDGPGLESYLEDFVPTNQVKYLKYVVVVNDGFPSFNKAMASVLVESDTRMSLDSALPVVPAQGLATGGTRIIVRGSGFGNNAVVTINNLACDEDAGASKFGAKRYSSRILSCKTPSRVSGSGQTTAQLKVQNPDGTIDTANFNYWATGTPNACDDSANRNPTPTGTGATAGEPVLICTPAQIQTLASQGANITKNKFITLGDHIDMTGITLANSVLGETGITNPYAKTLDGAGYIIENLNILNSTASYLGFIGVGTTGVVVKNIAFINPIVASTHTATTGTRFLGVVLGSTVNAANLEQISNVDVVGGTVSTSNVAAVRGGLIAGQTGAGDYSNIYAKGTLNNFYVAGGAVGEVSGSITMSNVETEGSVSATEITGGVIGQATVTAPTLTLLRSSASVTATLTSSGGVGGVIGKIGTGAATSYIVSDTLFTGTVLGYDYCGGIIGNLDASTSATAARIFSSVNRGTINCRDSVGGIFGRMNDGAAFKLTSLRNEGTVIGRNSVGGIGGYVSRMNPTSACYSSNDTPCFKRLGNIGSVSGGDSVGGLFGHITQSASLFWGFSVERAYSTGPVSASGTGAGGLVGNSIGGASTANVYKRLLIKNSYVTSDVSATTTSVGGLFGAFTTQNASDPVNNPNGYEIDKVYVSASMLPATATNKGALIGSWTHNTVVMKTFNAFWNSTLQANAFGSGPSVPTGVVSKTTTELKDDPTYTGWDFYDSTTNTTGIWQKVEGSTPKLKWESCIIPNPAGVTQASYCTD